MMLMNNVANTNIATKVFFKKTTGNTNTDTFGLLILFSKINLLKLLN